MDQQLVGNDWIISCGVGRTLGALHYGNKEWMPGNSAAFYAVFFTIVMTLVTIAVGIPLAQLIF